MRDESRADAADRRILARHQPVDGHCPICHTRGRCWTWAMAYGNLAARGLLAPDSGGTRPPAR